jgi:hypothetical protein
MASSELWRRLAVIRTEVSEERIASTIKVTRNGELGTTLAVTSNWRTVLALGSSETSEEWMNEWMNEVTIQEIVLIFIERYWLGSKGENIAGVVTTS